MMLRKFFILLILVESYHCYAVKNYAEGNVSGNDVESGMIESQEDEPFIVLDEDIAEERGEEDAQTRDNFPSVSESEEEESEQEENVEEEEEEEEGEKEEEKENEKEEEMTIDDEEGSSQILEYNNEEDNGSAQTIQGHTNENVVMYTVGESSGTSSEDREFQTRLRKIKKIPASKSILKNNEKNLHYKMTNKMAEPQKHQISIKFIIKQKSKQTTESDEVSGNEVSGSGAEDAKIKQANSESNSSNNTISTYIIKDAESSGASGSGGSGSEEDSVSGSGEEVEKVLTYTLKAVTHPLKIKNETTHLGNSTEKNARERRHIPETHHQNQKKTFVPPTEMYIPDKNDLQSADQIENLFYTSLHSDFHARPEFGSRSDPWSDTDIRELSDLAGNDATDTKEERPQQESMLKAREFAPSPEAAPIQEFQRPNELTMSEPPQLRMNEHQAGVGEPVPVGEENRILGGPYQTFTNRFIGGRVPPPPADTPEEVKDVSEEMKPAPAVEQHHFQSHYPKPEGRGVEQIHPVDSSVKLTNNIENMAPSGEEATERASVNAKVRAEKESKYEMEKAEAKYQEMESSRIKQELLGRKDNFDMMSSANEQKASVRSYLRKKHHKKQKTL